MFNFLYFQPTRDLSNLWHDEYYYILWDGAFLDLIFWATTQVIKLGQLIDTNKGDNFLESYEKF